MKAQRLIPSLVGRPWARGRFGIAGGEPVGEVLVSGDDATLADGRTLASAGLASSVPLVKLLDIGARLSVQVHPDDRLARELHGRAALGKHEAWVVLDADADASFAIGLVDPSRLDDLFSGYEGRVVGSLAVQRVAPGSVIDVAPGTIHAPGPGVLLLRGPAAERPHLPHLGLGPVTASPPKPCPTSHPCGCRGDRGADPGRRGPDLPGRPRCTLPPRTLPGGAR